MNGTKLDEIITRLRCLAPKSRQNMVKGIEKILSGLVLEAIDSHNTRSVIFIFYAEDGNKYLLKAEYGIGNATSREILWYQALPIQAITTSVPVATSCNQGYSFLLLNYIEDAKTLDELVDSNSLSEEQLYGYINDALSKDQQIFTNSKPSIVSLAISDKFYTGKYESRVLESQKFDYLKKLLNSSGYILNGKPVYAPSYYLARIAGDHKLRAYLTPSKLGLIHGDLHCGNILVSRFSTYLVDPNGELQMPIEYDYGKIFHSIHGGYNSIMKEGYVLNKTTDGSYFFKVQVPGLYTNVFLRFQQDLTDQQFLRGLYAEAMHFATLLPHHASKEMETTALFMRSVQIFEELFYNMNIK